MELQFCVQAPRDAAQARAAMDDAVERGLHLWLLNRGIVITPFHNMLLASPRTRPGDAEPLARALDDFLSAVRA
jgi:glutamate-1-semialdehyde 2,1-aminomutase